MAWIKRNLIFVACVAVGVALLGVAIFLLVGSISENQEASDKFQTAWNELKTLQDKKPFPSKENIEATKADKERMKGLLNDFKKMFASFPPAPKTDDKGFKTYLQNAITELQAGAGSASVQIPADYAFSFSSQVGKLNFSSECIQPWMEQLQEIKAICGILYAAKINYLQGLQRVPACRDDSGGNDYLGATAVTNQTGVTTPYKIMFLGFSSEIAAVLDGFERSSNCFIVKDIDVSMAKEQPGNAFAGATPAVSAYSTPNSAAPARDARAEFDRRYGPGAGGPARPAPSPAASAGARPAPASASVPILWEKQLFVTLSVDVLKLKTAER